MRSRLAMTVAFLVMSMCMLDVAFAGKGKGPERLLLGPTGITGDVTKNAIKVVELQPGSPADGKLQKGDEIIGIGTSTFQNVKREMAQAIDVAETEAAGGKMALMLKGDRRVEITLPVLGSYSATAPWKCRKSDAIIRMAADSVVKALASKREKEDGRVCQHDETQPPCNGGCTLWREKDGN